MKRLVPLFLLAACGGEPIQPQLRPLLEIISGADQIDTVARQLPLPVAALVIDSASARPLAGVVLNWFRVVGTDSVFLGAGATNDSGIGRMRPTLASKAGPQTTVAWALDGNGNRTVFAAAQATATPDKPDTIVLYYQSVRLTLGERLALSEAVRRLSDQYGNDIQTLGGITYDAAKWTRSADTIWSDDTERQDTVYIRSGLRAAPLAVGAWYDLLAHQWDVGFTCYGSTLADSARYSLTTDTVYRINGSQGWMEGAGSVRMFLKAGGETVEPLALRIGWAQTPDSLTFRDSGNRGESGSAVVTSRSPRTYEGGNLCGTATGWTTASPATIRAR